MIDIKNDMSREVQISVTLERVTLLLEQNKQAHDVLSQSVKELREGISDPDSGLQQRVRRLEDNMDRVAVLAKWFFGGGFIAAVASAYFFIQFINQLGEFLEKTK
jgi:uncharacterized protein Yka (UPF0111/DUF47 family)